MGERAAQAQVRASCPALPKGQVRLTVQEDGTGVQVCGRGTPGPQNPHPGSRFAPRRRIPCDLSKELVLWVGGLCVQNWEQPKSLTLHVTCTGRASFRGPQRIELVHGKLQPQEGL